MKNITNLKNENDIQLAALVLNKRTQQTLVVLTFILAGVLNPLFALLCMYFFARSLSTGSKIKKMKESMK